MSTYRSPRIGFALLLVLLLSMQGFAAMPSCGSASAAAHCAGIVGGAPGVAHHGCDHCCCVLVPASASMHRPTEMAGVPIPASLTAIPAPAVHPDRLDRPPR